MSRPRIAPEIEDRIVALTRQGLSAVVIADIVGTTARTVQRVRVRRGAVVYHSPSITLTADEIATAERLLSEGAPFAEVARTLGMGTRAVRLRWPGQGWSRTECGQFAAFMGRMRARGAA